MVENTRKSNNSEKKSYKNEINKNQQNDYELCIANANTMMATFEIILHNHFKKFDKLQYDNYIFVDFSQDSYDELISQVFTQLSIFNNSYKLLKIVYNNLSNFKVSYYFGNIKMFQQIVMENNDEKKGKNLKILLDLALQIIEDKNISLDSYNDIFIKTQNPMNLEDIKQIGIILSNVNYSLIPKNGVGKLRTENDDLPKNEKNSKKKNDLKDKEQILEIIDKTKNFVKCELK